MSIRRILVPTDFSDAADRALKQAVVLAHRTGAALHLLHRLVYPFPVIPTPAVEEGEPFDGPTARTCRVYCGLDGTERK